MVQGIPYFYNGTHNLLNNVMFKTIVTILLPIFILNYGLYMSAY